MQSSRTNDLAPPPGPVALVVEDEFLIRLLLEEALTEAGWRFLSAGSVGEALALLDAEGGRIDGLITDVRLAEGGLGWDVAERVREMNARTPVVYITGDSQSDWLLRGVPESRLLVKPFIVETAVEILIELSNTVALPD